MMGGDGSFLYNQIKPDEVMYVVNKKKRVLSRMLIYSHPDRSDGEDQRRQAGSLPLAFGHPTVQDSDKAL